MVKSTVEISQNFVAFSEYMYFNVTSLKVHSEHLEKNLEKQILLDHLNQ